MARATAVLLALGLVLTWAVPAFVAVPTVGVAVHFTHAVDDVDFENCGDGTGYNTIRGGVKWAAFPVKYRILDGGDFGASIRASFQVWDDQDHPVTDFFDEVSSDEDVSFTFDSIDGEGSVLGRTTVWFTLGRNKEITRAEIVLDSGEDWDDLPLDCATGVPPFDVGAVAVHEIGHAVGLDHNSNSVYLTMYPYYIGAKGRTLATGDIGGFGALYGDEGGDDDGGGGGGGACPPGNPNHPKCS